MVRVHQKLQVFVHNPAHNNIIRIELKQTPHISLYEKVVIPMYICILCMYIGHFVAEGAVDNGGPMCKRQFFAFLQKKLYIRTPLVQARNADSLSTM